LDRGSAVAASETGTQALAAARWGQLFVGVVCMATVANLNYGWYLFAGPIGAKFLWGRDALQLAFAFFMAIETWLAPAAGWFADRFGPRRVVMVGGIMVGAGWLIEAAAASPELFYAAVVLSGIGVAAVYAACLGNALKWFPDRRGLAAGLTTAGFGTGAALTIAPIREMIQAYGYQSALLWAGVAQGLVIVVLAQILAAPKAGQIAELPSSRVEQSRRDLAPIEVLRTPLFAVLYVMFVLAATAGLMGTAGLVPIARDHGVADAPVGFLFVNATMPALALVLALGRVLSGLARPLFGWLSDRAGREATMGMAFVAGTASMLELGYLGSSPWAFVMTAATVYFTWGAIDGLFAAVCTDAFGTEYAATNAGMLYTAKGIAGLLVPFVGLLVAVTGSWHAVSTVAAILDVIAAVASLFVLRPLMRSWLEPARSVVGWGYASARAEQLWCAAGVIATCLGAATWVVGIAYAWYGPQLLGTGLAALGTVAVALALIRAEQRETESSVDEA
jgi:OFA family oxalate/formate antiporter-like MFS transporter